MLVGEKFDPLRRESIARKSAKKRVEMRELYVKSTRPRVFGRLLHDTDTGIASRCQSALLWPVPLLETKQLQDQCLVMGDQT